MTIAQIDYNTAKRPSMSKPDLAPSQPSANSVRRRLLLVDDNLEGRGALARLMEFHDFEVISVSDGASAIKALNEGPKPDVVLTDYILPDIDGREVARPLGPSTPRRSSS